RREQLGDRHGAGGSVFADEEDRLEARNPAEQRLDAREQPLVDDQEPAARIDEPVLELLGGPPALETHPAAPPGGRADKPADPVRAVVREDREAVSLREAVVARECARGTPDAAREIAVAEAPRALDQEVDIAARRGRGDLVAQRALAILEHLHRATAHRLGDDLERRSGRGEIADDVVVTLCHRAPRGVAAPGPTLPLPRRRR